MNDKESIVVQWLIEEGYSVRKARAVVRALQDVMIEALKRHEDVVTPLGVFRVVPVRAKPRRRWRFGQPQQTFRSRYRVVLEPLGEHDG